MKNRMLGMALGIILAPIGAFAQGMPAAAGNNAPGTLQETPPLEDAKDVVKINGVRYTSEMAKGAVKEAGSVSINFGSQDKNVGGAGQDVNHATEGIPPAFVPVKDGAVWILDSLNGKIKRFSADGTFSAAVPLLKEVFPEAATVRDIAPAPEGGFYVLSPVEKMIKRIDKQGKEIMAVEGMEDIQSISADSRGFLLVSDPAKNALMCFNPAGELDWNLAGIEGLTPISDKAGLPYGMKGDDTKATLFQVTDVKSGAIKELASFNLDFPPDKKVTFANHRILGTDETGFIYVELPATDPNGVIYQHRMYKVSADGKQVSFKEVLVKPFFSPGLPRDFAVLANGRIMGYSADEMSYQLITYDLSK